MRIFLDVDGVLIDGWHVDPALRKPWNLNLKADFGVNPELFEERFFKPQNSQAESLMHGCTTGTLDLKEALSTVLPGLGYSGDINAFVAYWFEKDANINLRVLGIAEQLGTQRDCDLYLATGQEHYRAQYLWEELNFSRYFRKLFYSADLGFAKTDVRFFEAVNSQLKLDPTDPSNHSDRPLFFDDSCEVVDVATRAGWEAVVFNSIDDLLDHPQIKHLL